MGLQVREGCCSSVQQVGFLCVPGGVVFFFFPLSGLGNQALSLIFVSAFLCFRAWETELSICCCLCLEMGHGGDLGLVPVVPSSEPPQPTCLPPSRGSRHCQLLQREILCRKATVASGEH